MKLLLYVDNVVLLYSWGLECINVLWLVISIETLLIYSYGTAMGHLYIIIL